MAQMSRKEGLRVFAEAIADAATIGKVGIARGMQPLPEKVLEAGKEEGEHLLHLLTFYVLSVTLTVRKNRKPAVKASWEK